jgi:hypothetical protein
MPEIEGVMNVDRSKKLHESRDHDPILFGERWGPYPTNDKRKNVNPKDGEV